MNGKRIFSSLTEEEEKSILAACDKVFLSENEVLFKKGDKTNALYIVMEGELNVLDEQPGQRILIAGLHEGDIFGEMSFLDERPRSATVKAETDAVVLCFTKEDFVRLVVEQPRPGARFMITIGKFLVDRLRTADAALNSMTKSGFRVDEETLGKLKDAVRDY